MHASPENGGDHSHSRPGRAGRGSLITSLVGVAAVIAGALSALVPVLPAGAVDATGQFELDGDIVHSSANTPPYDWASLFNASGQRIVTPDPGNRPPLATTFLAHS